MRQDGGEGGVSLMRLADVVVDNPLLVKHVRSRLRLAQVLPTAAVVVVLGACSVWAGESIPWIGSTSAVTMLLGLQILALTFGGSNQINTSLGGARESGILDFHRVSPVPPSLVALGFFLGAPIREYALVALTLPFAFYSAFQIDAEDPLRGVFWLEQLEVALLLTTWNFHATAMIGCLTRKKPRGSVQGIIVAVVFLLIFGYLGSFGLYFGVRWLIEGDRRLNFFGFMIPWLAWVVIYELPLLGFLGLAVARKMRAERAHSYAKPQALAALTTLAVLGVGGLWNVSRLMPNGPPFEPTLSDLITIAAVYVLALAAMILTVTITPDSGEYLKGVRRARREGGRRPSPWLDAGSNRVALFALCAIVLAGATAVVNVIGREHHSALLNPQFWANNPELLNAANLSDKAWLASRQAMISRPIAIGVLTVAYVGLALQFFSLRTRKSGAVLTSLFLFVVWLVPLVAGSVIGTSAPGNSPFALVILALSPLPGIGLSSGLGHPPSADAIQLAALAPPIAFAFIFNYLLVITQRKLDRSFQANEQEKEKVAAEGELTGAA